MIRPDSDEQGDGAFAELRVERVRKPDGRYLLYYSWPDRGALESAGEQPPEDISRTPGTRAWTPEAGPTNDADV